MRTAYSWPWCGPAGGTPPVSGWDRGCSRGSRAAGTGRFSEHGGAREPRGCRRAGTGYGPGTRRDGRRGSHASSRTHPRLKLHDLSPPCSAPRLPQPLLDPCFPEAYRAAHEPECNHLASPHLELELARGRLHRRDIEDRPDTIGAGVGLETDGVPRQDQQAGDVRPEPLDEPEQLPALAQWP